MVEVSDVVAGSIVVMISWLYVPVLDNGAREIMVPFSVQITIVVVTDPDGVEQLATAAALFPFKVVPVMAQITMSAIALNSLK